ncbi:LGFP repeat-containing protein [Modestobacter sp. SYSU DS0290]
MSGEEAGTAGRFRQRFTGGDLHWSAATGGHPVVGGLRVAYERLGADAGRLGSPRSAEQSAGDGRGFWQRFEGGDLWWSSRTGGMQVTGGIGAHWQRHGGVTGGLGYPTTDEAGLPDGRGIAQQFEGGAVHWTASTGAHPTVGGIGALWQRHGAAAGLLGYPTTDERALADGRGIVQSYERGAVYWTAQTGAHLVTGAIGALYAQLGAERGSLGYPTEDEAAVDGGIVGRFEGGSILWTPTGGPRVVSR